MPEKAVLAVLKPNQANLRTLASEEETTELVHKLSTAAGYEERRVTVIKRTVRYTNF